MIMHSAGEGKPWRTAEYEVTTGKNGVGRWHFFGISGLVIRP
jgi:hypothetical protein